MREDTETETPRRREDSPHVYFSLLQITGRSNPLRGRLIPEGLQSWVR